MAKTEKIFIRLPEEMHTQILAEATARTESASVVVREALREYFDKRKKKPVPIAPPSDPGQTNRFNEPHTPYKPRK
jgi:hypothetical protein